MGPRVYLCEALLYLQIISKKNPCPLVTPLPPHLSSLPHFQLAPDGWSKAIRSKYSSPRACSFSLPQTPHRHTLLRQEGKNQLCSTAPLSMYSLVHSSAYPFSSLVFIHHVFHSPPHWHPPICLPTHLLVFSLLPPAEHCHYLTTSSITSLSFRPVSCRLDSLFSKKLFLKSSSDGQASYLEPFLLPSLQNVNLTLLL